MRYALSSTARTPRRTSLRIHAVAELTYSTARAHTVTDELTDGLQVLARITQAMRLTGDVACDSSEKTWNARLALLVS